MNKTKYILIVGVAVLSLALWSNHLLVGGTVQGRGASDTFEASWLIGYRAYDPVYEGDLGQITDLLIDRCDGRVAFVVLSDTPGFVSDFVAVPFPALERTGEHTFRVMFRGHDVPLAYQGLDWEGARYAKYLEDHRDIVGLKSIPATVDPAWAERVYNFYGVAPHWTAGTSPHPEFASYRMSGRTDDFAIHYPGGGIVAGAAPYWTSCSTCGPEAMDFAGLADPALPSDARAGECYARFFVAPRCETRTEQVMIRPASERVEQIPAKYETVEERVMVSPASTRTEEVPAEYKTVEERVLVEPARTEWKAGRGAVEKMDPTGKIMCLVEIPAQYKMVSKQVLVKPATTREVEIPAQFEMRKVEKMIEPAQERHIQIPAEYKTDTKNVQVSDGYFEWRKVDGCQPQ